MHPTTLHIILPVGISFYTFQTMSYTIDVYRGRLGPTRNVIDFFAFVSFFPQLVAGPIERASNLLPQFAAARRFDTDAARDGCRQMLWGFAKKLVIADNLARFVDPIYANAGSHSGPMLVLATVLFAFQIYCDFSAYSDIAIGTARLFGIRLMRNFAYPYFSQSLGEFWRRWHISLSTWFRDYVYIPLGGSRAGGARRRVNVLITFLVSGLWHGAAWNFVVWGGVNGAVLGAGGSGGGVKSAKPKADTPGGEHLLPRPGTLLRIAATFTIVCAAWVFFRARGFNQAIAIHGRILADLFSPAAWYADMLAAYYTRDMVLVLSLLTGFVLIEWLQRRHDHPLHLAHWPLPLRWAVYTLLIWGGILFSAPQQSQFIYFQF